MSANRVSTYIYSGDYITLGQFIKAVNLVSSGGEAKSMLQSGAVMVNGQIETRRGCKLRHNDVVTFGQMHWRLISATHQV
jgi:ribosome-associated protein